jgi:hypothetical protein
MYVGCQYIVTYRPVAKRGLCKQRPLLVNARNIHARNIRTTGLCNPFVSNGSGNMFPRKLTRATNKSDVFDMFRAEELS